MITVTRNVATILFFVITAINLAIAFYRDKFMYHKYATRSSLYSADTLKWKKLIDDYPKQELIEAKTIIDSLSDFKDKSTTSKVLEIGKLFYHRFHDQIGKPSPLTRAVSPLNQFKNASASDSVRLWCGDFAFMFVFFCWAEGIPCRVVGIMNPGNHHVLNECYLRESKEWVLVDVTTNHLLFFNKNRNRFENLLDVRDSSFHSLQSFQLNDGEIVTTPFAGGFYDRYFGNGKPLHYYYRINSSEIYKQGEKITRYFLPVAWYEELSRTHPGNFWFYIKQFFVLLWLISLAVVIKKMTRSKSGLS
jgi:transglutaminase superfamily protein